MSMVSLRKLRRTLLGSLTSLASALEAVKSNPARSACMYLSRYARFQEAKTGVFDYVRFYNHRRCHSTLGYLSLMEFERRNASSSS